MGENNIFNQGRINHCAGIGVARGVQWVHLHPPGRCKKNFFRPNLQEKCASAPPQDTKCTPQPEQESIFKSFCWVVKKCTPADKILATPMRGIAILWALDT